MPLVVVAERGDVTIRNYPAMPPTKDKLARTKRSPGEDAFAFGAGIFDQHVRNHRQPPRSLTVPRTLGHVRLLIHNGSAAGIHERWPAQTPPNRRTWRTLTRAEAP